MKTIFLYIAIVWPGGEVTVEASRHYRMADCLAAAEMYTDFMKDQDYIGEVWCEAAP